MKSDLFDVRNGLLMLEQYGDNQDFELLTSENKIEVLSYALTESVSIYWPNLALEWIEINSYIINDSLRDILLKSTHKPWAQQVFKQKIRKILKTRISGLL